MSIVIKKKETVRNTPILNYALVLCIPILLSFLAGTSVKSVNTLNRNTALSTLGDCEDQLKQQTTNNQNLMRITDTLTFLKQEFKKTIVELESSLPAATDDKVKLNKWNYTEKDPKLLKWERDVNLLRESYIAEFDKSFQNQINNQFDLFSEIILLYKLVLENEINKVNEKLEQNATNAATAQISAAAAKIPTPSGSDPCFQEKMQLINLNQQISDIKSDLRNCQSELMDNKRSMDQVKGNSNKAIVEKLKSELKFVQENSIPKINQSLFGKSSKMDQLKDELSNKVNNMLIEINNIK